MLNKQGARSEKLMLHFLVKHYKQTQNSQNLFLVVGTKQMIYPKLIHLWQTTEDIGEKGAKSLSDALKSNTTLTKLNLSGEH